MKKPLSAFFLPCLMCAALSVGAAPVDPVVEKAAAAKSVAEVLAAFGVQNPEVGKKIALEVPDIVDGGAKSLAKVPVKVLSKIPGTDWIAVMVDKNLTPFAAAKDFSPGMDRTMEVTVDMSRTSKVRVLVRAGGKYFQVAREVKVATPDCGKP